MTELLPPIHIDPPKTAEHAQGTVTRLADSFPGQVVDLQAARAERDIALLDDISPQDLVATSTRELRMMANQAYKLMDTDHPPASAINDYTRIANELEHRALQATERDSKHQPKESFRDNPLYTRFELFIDGTLSAYVKYTMIGGQLIILDGVEQPEFRDQGLITTLMRHVVLNSHKRRLTLVPRCAVALSFLADNPQYQLLTGQPGR